MNSAESTQNSSPALDILLNTDGPSPILTTASSRKSWNDAPLEDMIGLSGDLPPIRVDLMSDEELVSFTKRCQTLRQSSQAVKATIVKESVKHGGKGRKKDSLGDETQNLLNQLLGL